MEKGNRFNRFSIAAALAALLLLPMAGPAQEIRLTGRIVDRALLKPVPGAIVRLASQPAASDTTGADGRFSLVRTSSALIAPVRSMVPEGASSVDALGRLHPAWSPAPFRSLSGKPSQSTAALAKAAAERIEITREGLAPKSLDVAEPVKDVGDVVLDYPSRKLGVGAPPIYGSVILFDGRRATLDAEWEHWMGTYRKQNGLGPTPITWNMVDDPVDEGQVLRTCCRVQWGDEDLVTKKKFRDFQVHLEFNLVSAPRVGGSNPGPANSGVYLQSLYEIQIKDDYGMTLGNHDAGAILNEFAAPVNLGKPRGQWQAYDITFRAARFKDGKRTEKARLTMHWNGTVAHRNRETANEHNVGVSSDSLGDGAKGFKLQSEGHDVRFRNVWIKELDLAAPETDLGY